VNELDRRGELEDLGAFEEERAQLVEEERKPLIHRDLRLVRLDLREIWIDREIGGEVGGDAVLQIQPGLGKRHGVG